ncbi:MAG TPA: RHS repeat-associated core domain-containing protein [Pyrinomonadaceae bacterium]
MNHSAARPSSTLPSCLRLVRRAALLLFLLCHVSAVAQTVEHTENSADQSLRSGARVDPSTLGMGLEIPLGNLPGRAGTGLPVGLSYSSKVWRIEYTSSHSTRSGYHTRLSPRFAEDSAAGWTTSLAVPRIEYTGMSNHYRSDGQPRGEDLEGSNSFEPRFYIARINVHLPDGSSHELRRDDEPHLLPDGQGPDFSGVFRAVDGSRLRYDNNEKTLYLPDGSRYLLGDPDGGLELYGQPSPPTLFIDRNGNTLTYNHQTRQWTDTLGRTLGLPLPRTPARGDTIYSLPRVGGGGVNYVLRWRNLSEALTDPAQPLHYIGQHQCGSTYTRVSGSYLFESDPPNFVCAPQIFNPVVLAEIELPTGQKYRFTYNVYGEIDKVSFPTGGYERFTYAQMPGLTFANLPYSRANRGVNQRRVSASGTGTDEALWEYGVTTGTLQSPPYTAYAVAPDLTRSERVLQTGSGGGHTPRYGFQDARVGRVLEERSFSAPDQNGVRQLLRRRLNEWAVTNGSNGATRDPRVIKDVRLVLDTGGDALAQTTSYQHDADQNVTSTTLRHYAAVSQATAQTGAISAMPLGATARTDETTFVVNDPSLAQATRDAYRARNLVGLPSSSRVRNASGAIVSQAEVRYDEAAYAPLACGATVGWSDPLGNVRGLETTARIWLDTTNTWIETHTQFDQCGSLRKVWDARGKVSEVEYSAAYHFAYPTLKRSPVPDPTGQYGSTSALVTETTYDFSTGRVIAMEDANDQLTSLSYTDDGGAPDALGRLRKVVRPGGGWTKYLYARNHQGDYVNTQTLQNISGVVESSYMFFDGMGRPSRLFVYENQDSSNQWLTSDTEYDAMGRVKRVSRQYRSTGSATPPFSTDKWVETTYDALGRVQTSKTMPDGATVTTVYSGNQVTVTDQAGKQLRRVADALGRLARVVEDPAGLAYATDYTYDAPGNLRKVDQGGQHRFFAYDSLGRLVRAKNPEQGSLTADADFPGLADPVTGNSAWSVGYVYDAASNLTKRKDARNVVATYAYDGLNRQQTVSYTDATPAVVRTYDGATLGRGRIWRSATTQTARTTFEEYDVEGRPLRQSQQFWVGGQWGTAYTLGQTYNLAGGVTTQTYPSGHTTTYTYDVVGRPANFVGELGDGTARTYSSGIIYDETGGMKREQYGTQTPLYKRLFYNSRGQLSDIRVGTHHASDDGWWNRGAILNVYSAQAAWTESGPDNNGSLRKQMIFIPNDEDISGWTQMTQYYGYDALNRLASVEEKRDATDFFQTYSYDRWGNRTINAAATWDTSPAWDVPEPQFELDASNPAYREVAAPSNRLYAPGDGGRLPGQKLMGYDAAGHLVNDSYTGGGARSYDAEGRMTTAQFFGGPTAVYTYDAEGRRVKRQVGAGAAVWQVYGMGGELLAEYAANAAPSSPQKEYGYRAGELLVAAEAGAAAAAPQPVTWQNVAGVSTSASSLTKTGGAAWDAGASSVQSIASGDGYLEFTAGNVSDRMCGLSVGDSSQHYNDIDFAIYPNGGNYVDVYEGGTIKWGGVVSYQAGDRFRIAVEGGAVKYYKVGAGGALTHLYTSAVAPGYPLRADTSLHTTGAQLTNVTISGGQTGAAAAATVGNAGFEAPVVGAGGYLYNPSGGAWAFAGGSGVSGNGSPFTAGNPAAPQGTQVAYVQGGSSSHVSQQVTGLQTGVSYAVTFKAAQRGNCCAGGGQDFDVYVDGTLLGTYKPAGASYQEITATFTASGATQVLKFTGRNTAGGDNTAFIDDVKVKPASTAGGGVKWLVTDHLGTPRMVLDQTGTLSGVKRHDYLSFGGELPAGAGGRTAARGYSQTDNLRQQFTGYERDAETGLDYARARFYANVQGRFTSVDPANAGADPHDPQSWNGYSYVLNRPLSLVDPNGLSASSAGGCSAEFSYERCGGDDGFWGGSGFGDDVAMFHDLRGMSAGSRAFLLRYEAGVNNAFYGGGDGNSVVAYFDIYYTLYEDGSLETWFTIDGGTTGGYNPLWEVARDFNRSAPAMKKVILGVTAANLTPIAVAAGSGSLAGVGTQTLGLGVAQPGEFALIGSMQATPNLLGMPNVNILSVPKWTPAIQAAWLQRMVALRIPFLMTAGPMVNQRTGQITQFGKEVLDLTGRLGYTRYGQWLLPPR